MPLTDCIAVRRMTSRPRPSNFRPRDTTVPPPPRRNVCCCLLAQPLQCSQPRMRNSMPHDTTARLTACKSARILPLSSGHPVGTAAISRGRVLTCVPSSARRVPREFAVAADIPADPVELENDCPARDDSETPRIPASKVLGFWVKMVLVDAQRRCLPRPPQETSA